MISMANKETALSLSLLDELHTSGAGYNVLRYISLPNLFGEESSTMLYFMGKNLARSLNLSSLDDLYHAADKLGWGRLELVKKKRRSLTFNLMADAIFHRLQASVDVDFRMEAGCIAETVQLLEGVDCECVGQIHPKIHLVGFSVIYTA